MAKLVRRARRLTIAAALLSLGTSAACGADNSPGAFSGSTASGSGGSTPSCTDVSCDDKNACTEDTCSSGACKNNPVAPGTGCGGGPGMVCDGGGACVGGAPVWSALFGDAGDQRNGGLAIDPKGNIFINGFNGGVLDLGGGKPLQSTSGSELFIAKLDPNGKYVWAKTFPGSMNDGIDLAHVAADANGNVIACGSLQGSVDFGGGALVSAGLADVFVAKFDGSGNALWSKRFGDNADQECFGVAVDGSGNVVLVGYSNGTVDFGGGPLKTQSGQVESFAVKLSPEGGHLWSKTFGTGVVEPQMQHLEGVAITPSGDIALGGVFSGAINFGGETLTHSNGSAVVVAKLDPFGKHIWSKQFSESTQGANWGRLAASADAVVVTGSFSGAIDFGGALLTAANGNDEDGFVASLDASGAHRWSRRFGDPSAQQLGEGVAIRPSGSVVMSAQSGDAVDLGGGPLAGAGPGAVFLGAYAVNGVHLYSKAFGANAISGPIAIQPSGAVVLFGNASQSIDFGSGPLTFHGGRDIFLAIFGP